MLWSGSIFTIFLVFTRGRDKIIKIKEKKKKEKTTKADVIHSVLRLQRSFLVNFDLTYHFFCQFVQLPVVPGDTLTAVPYAMYNLSGICSRVTCPLTWTCHLQTGCCLGELQRYLATQDNRKTKQSQWQRSGLTDFLDALTTVAPASSPICAPVTWLARTPRLSATAAFFVVLPHSYRFSISSRSLQSVARSANAMASTEPLSTTWSLLAVAPCVSWCRALKKWRERLAHKPSPARKRRHRAGRPVAPSKGGTHIFFQVLKELFVVLKTRTSECQTKWKCCFASR